MAAARGHEDRWITIPRWDDFQHRDMARSSVPPWIKNYTRLLSDDNYLALSIAQRGLLHGIWLMFATHRRSVNEATTKRLLVTNKAEARHFQDNLEALNHAGFIQFSASRPASNPASDLASLEVEREKNTRAVTSTRPADTNGHQLTDQPPTDDTEQPTTIDLEHYTQLIAKEIV